MLRVQSFTRLAPFHSPFREQRLLFVDPTKKDPQAEGNPESNPEQINGTSEPLGPLEKVSNQFRRNLDSVAPELILEELNRNPDVLNMIIGSGALHKEIRNICNEIGVSQSYSAAMTEEDRRESDRTHEQNLEGLSPEQKSDIIEKLLTQGDENRIVRIIGAIQEQLDRHEELSSNIERGMKRFFGSGNKTKNYDESRNEADSFLKLQKETDEELRAFYGTSGDPVAIEKAMKRISEYEATESEEILQEAFATKSITKDNITEILGIKGEFTEPQRERLFDALHDLAKATRIRQAFGQKPSTINDPKARREQRNAFLLNIENNASVLKQYLEAKIHARATDVQKLRDSLQQEAASEGLNDQEFLDTHGISALGYSDALDQVQVTIKEIERSFSPSEEKEFDIKNRPLPEEKNYLESAESALRRLEQLRRDLAKSEEKDKLPKYIEAQRIQEDDVEKWVVESADKLSRIKQSREELVEIAGEKTADSITEYRKYFAPYYAAKEKNIQKWHARNIGNETLFLEQKRISRLIEQVSTKPRTLKKISSMEASGVVEQSKIEGIIAKSRAELKLLLPEILDLSQHGASSALGIPERLETLQMSIAADMQFAEIGTDQSSWNSASPALQEKISHAAWSATKSIEQLKTLSERLQKIKDRDPSIVERIPTENQYFSVTNSRTQLGAYSYESGSIYLNTAKIDATPGVDEEYVLSHEEGHAIIDAFRLSNVFPNLLLDVYGELESSTGKKDTKFVDLLHEVSKTKEWNVDLSGSVPPSDDDKWRMIDELALKYSDFTAGKLDNPTEDEQRLFSLFKKNKPDLGSQGPRKLSGLAKLEGLEMGEHEDTETPPEAEAVPLADTLMDKLRADILNCDAFILAYPEFKDEMNKLFDYDNVKIEAAKLAKAFKSGAYIHDPRFIEKLQITLDYTKKFKEMVKEIDAEESDLTYVSKTGTRSLWRVVTEDISWVSIYDLVAMVKDSGSDIARMWKRRGEYARNRLGKAITEAIPGGVPYLGRLKHEFERRDRESEEEEVGVWEKGLDKIDSHVLQHEILPYVRSKDQLKAIIKMLAHRGRLDWDDEHGLWDKLEYYSSYRMPRGACRRDTDLRNQWIQKMMADIWRDKDMFEHTKVENDGAIQSHRKHFTNLVDDLAATGGHRKELKKLLVNYNKVKHHLPISKEEEVNPHLYEEILFYAMRNGKMSMEEKFFYLIKGVESGLLSLDRLRAFPGEDFGILNAFPFIDFFGTGQNCTRHEIAEIADAVTETGIGADPFSPGIKITKFLLERVAFDKNVYDRCNKGLKRAENIDHEDIPLLLTQVDYAGVEQIVNFTSGSQAKVSAQAMMNGYVGYNSFMKYFGIKAKIGKPPISDRDISKLSKTIAAYSWWDNLITKNSIGGTAEVGNRPFLSWEQINDSEPVSGAKKTCVYRNAMNEFVVKLSKRVGIHKVNGIDIEDYIGVTRNSGTGAEMARKYNMTEKEFFTKIRPGPQFFAEALQAGLSANKGILSDVLREAEATFTPESSDLNEAKMRALSAETPVLPSAGHGGH